MQRRGPGSQSQTRSDENKNLPKNTAGWTAVRQHLNGLDKPELIALLKDLSGASSGNKNFISARCQSADDGEVLEGYRSKVVHQFFPKRGFGKLKLGEARKAIQEYKKATGNIPGTAELLMSYVENGVEFTNEYGDIDGIVYHLERDPGGIR